MAAQYQTKDDIYSSYDMALKFALPMGPWKHWAYPEFFKELGGWTISARLGAVEALGGGHPTSPGFTASVSIGTQKREAVILVHETGLEIFLLGGAVGAVGGVGSQFAIRAIDYLVAKIRGRKWFVSGWEELEAGKHAQVETIQIRTKDLGVVELPIGEMTPENVRIVVGYITARKALAELSEHIPTVEPVSEADVRRSD